MCRKSNVKNCLKKIWVFLLEMSVVIEVEEPELTIANGLIIEDVKVSIEKMI